MARIRLSPSASITPTETGVLLRSDLGTSRLDGADVRVFVTGIVPLLDGTREPGEVAAALPGYASESVLGLLELLRQRGLVEPVPEGPGLDLHAAQERFFQGWQLPPGEGSARLRRSRVLIAGLSPWGAVAACELAAAGVGTLHLLDDLAIGPDDLLAMRQWGSASLGRLRRDALLATLAEIAPDCTVTTAPLAPAVIGDRLTVDPEGPWDLVLTGLTADDLFLLRRVSGFAHRQGVRSLYGHVDGFEAWIGPAVVPGETACWNCFRLRRLANADYPAAAHELDASLGSTPGEPRSRAWLAPMAPLAGYLLALEALQLLAGYTQSRLPGRVRIHNLVTGESAFHGLIRMPWCELCGGAAQARQRSGGVGPEADAEPGGGSLSNAETTEELRRRLAGWVDPRLGVVRSLTSGLAPVNGSGLLELPITGTAVLGTYTEGRLPAVPDPSIGSGKGLHEVEALVGAFGEAIERYSASRYRKQDLLVCSAPDLGADAFDPRRLALYSEEQYAQTGFPYARYDPERPIHWVEGFWIDNREKVWVPALPTFFNFQVCHHDLFCQVSSNGLAAGADLDDAALRALFELIERDAFLLTWLARLPTRRLAVDSSLDAGTREVVRLLGEHGVTVELSLLDAGTGIPTVVALGLGDGTHWPAAFVALSTHTDPRAAARKAILELAHVGPYMVRLLAEKAHIPATPEEVETLDDHALYYAPPERLAAFDLLRSGEMVSLGDLPAGDPPSLEQCAERLADAGLRVAAVDVTSPDVALGPFRVARVLGTDMQPIHFGERYRRLANPRLTALLAGRELNPDPHPLA